jgi:hypothetical protein
VPYAKFKLNHQKDRSSSLKWCYRVHILIKTPQEHRDHMSIGRKYFAWFYFHRLMNMCVSSEALYFLSQSSKLKQNLPRASWSHTLNREKIFYRIVQPPAHVYVYFEIYEADLYSLSQIKYVPLHSWAVDSRPCTPNPPLPTILRDL